MGDRYEEKAIDSPNDAAITILAPNLVFLWATFYSHTHDKFSFKTSDLISQKQRFIINSRIFI